MVQERRTFSINCKFIERRWCSLYGEIGKELYFSSWYRTSKPSIRTCAVVNWIIQMVPYQSVVFHHDNAWQYTSWVTRKTLLQFGWDVLLHTQYSSDLAPLDYHLFRSLQKSLMGMNFDSVEGVKNYLLQFFGTREKNFHERGISKFPQRWLKVVEQNVQYITEYNVFRIWINWHRY